MQSEFLSNNLFANTWRATDVYEQLYTDWSTIEIALAEFETIVYIAMTFKVILTVCDLHSRSVGRSVGRLGKAF